MQSQWSLCDLCDENVSILDFHCSERTGNCHALVWKGTQEFISFNIREPHATLYCISLNGFGLTGSLKHFILNYSGREVFLFTESGCMVQYKFPLAEFSLKCLSKRVVLMLYGYDEIYRLDIPRALKSYLYCFP